MRTVRYYRVRSIVRVLFWGTLTLIGLEFIIRTLVHFTGNWYGLPLN